MIVSIYFKVKLKFQIVAYCVRKCKYPLAASVSDTILMLFLFQMQIEMHL